VDINAATLIYFSPTDTTRVTLESIAQGIQSNTVGSINLTPPQAEETQFEELHDELAVIGAPVYGGRLPLVAVERLRRIKGNDTPAVLAVVYGNREFEDALLELRDIAVEQGFRPVAGGAFLGEHSYSSETSPIAHGRPDQADVDEAARFGAQVRDKLGQISALEQLPPLAVPGDFPYKERGQSSDISPVTAEGLCGLCRTCAEVCPTAAITVTNIVVTDGNACIKCSACVKKCPTGARDWEGDWIAGVRGWLGERCSERKEPKVYL
jgi:ferredoxin